MHGLLAEHPLAELIREVTNAGLSGALRLKLERAKVVVYFDRGALVFATSNLRAHRLREVLKRHGVTGANWDRFGANESDDDVLKGLESSGKITAEVAQAIRTNQVYDVLRVALLWTAGEWEFDQRVRLAETVPVDVDVRRLLLESARHLPFEFVQNRLPANADYAFASAERTPNLLPSEAAVLSRSANAGTAMRLPNLTTNGMSAQDNVRAVYALALADLLECSDWPSALNLKMPAKRKAAAPRPAKKDRAKTEDPLKAEVDLLFARLRSAKDHYEVLDVPRAASDDEIKSAYHTLALKFHPDRFHQSALRAEIESAFARIAQAYEVLSDPKRRNDYDRRESKPASRSKPSKPAESSSDAVSPQASRAATCFQLGLKALDQKQYDEAISSLAEAAMLAPREARYRANYGYALMSRSNMRRTAETELQAALAIEPDNAAYRVMLAELYQRLGLRRRAENEINRALTIDPKNQTARELLSKIKHA